MSAPAAPPAAPGKVLVVDDDPDSLRMILLGLESAGYDVLVATSGDDALRVLAHAVPDVILMDAVMRGIDGFETTRRIKATPTLRHVPVIFMTGMTAPEDVVRGLGSGGIDYVGKPVDLGELLARVQVHLARARAERTAVASLDATGRMMLATDGSGALLWCTPLAERALARFDPGWNRREGRLPAAMAAPVQRLCAQPEHGAVKLKAERGTGLLELAFVSRLNPREILLRLCEADPAKDAERLGAALSLTPREAEVLLWVGYGKGNREISEILSISSRTVHKHLERVFEKLGVETRSAAAVMAIRVLDQ